MADFGIAIGSVTFDGKDGRYDVEVEPHHLVLTLVLGGIAFFTSIRTSSSGTVFESYSQVRDNKAGDDEKIPIDKKQKENWERRLNEILDQIDVPQMYKVRVLKAKEFLAKV